MATVESDEHPTKAVRLILCVLIVVLMAFDYTATQEFRGIIKRVERWRPLVIEVNEYYGLPIELVLSIVAQESHGLTTVVSQDGYYSVGLMQVVPRDWTASSRELKDPRTNLLWGMWILDGALESAMGDTELALRYYNCGQVGVKRNPVCGKAYADKVLRFWMPYFADRVCLGGMCMET